jgi:hypothetical protein
MAKSSDVAGYCRVDSREVLCVMLRDMDEEMGGSIDWAIHRRM